MMNLRERAGDAERLGRPAASASGIPQLRLGRDPATGVPLYVQLRERLRADITERGLRPGDRLPTEAELEERYGVSRSTIRQAVGDLAAEGLVRRIQGKGTFVATPKIQHGPVLTSFSALLRSQGRDPSHELVETAVAGAPAAAAAGLAIDEGEPCRYLKRLFLADGEPVGVAETWLPLGVLGPLDDVITRGAAEDRSLYRLLEDSPDLAPHHAMETINPSIADDDTARLLRCDPGAPVLAIHRSSRTAQDQPLEWTRLLFVGGRYEYRVELVPPAEGRRA